MGHRRPVTLAVTVAALVLLAGCASVPRDGAGDASVATATSSGMPTGSASTVTDSCPAITTKPTGGLPHRGGTLSPQDLARQDANDAAWFVKRWAFIQALAAQGVDVRTLPQGELAVLLEPQPATPRQKATESDAVFVGTVGELHFNEWSTVADVTIEQVVKGDLQPTDVVPVALGFRLEPNRCLNGGELGVEPASPVLHPGQRAVFIATRADDYTTERYPARWDATLYSQAFPISGDTVSAEQTSPYGRLVDHLPVETFLRELAS